MSVFVNEFLRGKFQKVTDIALAMTSEFKKSSAVKRHREPKKLSVIPGIRESFLGSSDVVSIRENFETQVLESCDDFIVFFHTQVRQTLTVVLLHMRRHASPA